MSMFLLFCLFCACAAPIALSEYQPRTNNDFSSLLIHDHPSAAEVFADSSLSQFQSFWHLEKDPVERKAGAAGDSKTKGGSNSKSLRRKSARRLAEFHSIMNTFHVGDDAMIPAEKFAVLEGSGGQLEPPSMHVPMWEGVGTGRGLTDASGRGKVGGDGVRTEITRMLNIFYRYADNSTAITWDLVKKVCPAHCLLAPVSPLLVAAAGVQ
jgi:hypothetical protein